MKIRFLVFAVVLVFAGTAFLAASQQEDKETVGKGIEARVTILESTISLLQAALTQAQSQLTTQAASISALQAALAAHTTNPSAHHARYTDTEAQAAVGPVVTPAQLAPIQTTITEHGNLLFHFSRSNNDIFITGANLHVVNGLGQTPTTNALGNIIIGYNESRAAGSNERSGSHMLVVGAENNYTKFGGIIAGHGHATNGNYSSVTGGNGNIASGNFASATGGIGNTASGDFSSVTGGFNNTASGLVSSVIAGHTNAASGDYSSVSGGLGNNATGNFSAVSGGDHNTAGGTAQHLP